MTRENYRFVRTLFDRRRIIRIDPEKLPGVDAYLRNDEDFLEEYKGYDLTVFCALDGETPAGCIELTLLDDHVVVAHICVDDSKRNEGYGSLLLIKAKEYAMELGLSMVTAELPAGDPDIGYFFSENGFYPTEDEEEGSVAVWILEDERSDFLEDEKNEAEAAVAEVTPDEAILVPKLMRLKGFLQQEGVDAEIVTGEKPYIWADYGTYDLQITYLEADIRYERLYITFSAFAETEEAEGKSLCDRINFSNYFATAIPAEGGIILKYTLAETRRPIEEESFLSAIYEFRSEVERSFY